MLDHEDGIFAFGESLEESFEGVNNLEKLLTLSKITQKA